MKAKRNPIEYRLDLIPADVILEVSKVLANGAKKYGDNNWKQSRLTGENGPINHALKHILSYQAGIPDDEDPEGIDPQIHLRHAITNLIFELYYELHSDTYEVKS